MRNGNKEIANVFLLENSGSYPTYEEWKLSVLTLTNLAKWLGSYPTYEEWKPRLTTEVSHPLVSVLILPMRNGN